jgi:hypothetical protein
MRKAESSVLSQRKQQLKESWTRARGGPLVYISLSMRSKVLNVDHQLLGTCCKHFIIIHDHFSESAMCIEYLTITHGICPACNEISRHHVSDRRCWNGYLQQYGPPVARCQWGFPTQSTTSYALHYDNDDEDEDGGSWAHLAGPCYYCTTEGDNGNTGPVAEEDDRDPLERDLDDFIEAFTDADHIAAQEQIVRDAILQEEEARARQLLETLTLQEPQARLSEERTRLRNTMRARISLFLYTKDHPSAFQPRQLDQRRPRNCSSITATCSLGNGAAASSILRIRHSGRRWSE